MSSAPSERRRTRVRRMIGTAALALAVLGMASCSTPAPKEQALSDALVDSGFSRKVSDCAAKALTESLSPSELAELAERGAGGVPVDDPEKTDENIDKLTAAMATCRELQIATAPTTTTITAATQPEGATTTTAALSDGAQLNPASTTSTAP